MYLLHISGCLMRWHQLVRTLISIGAQTRFVCHAVSRFNCGVAAKVTVLSLTTSCFGLLF